MKRLIRLGRGFVGAGPSFRSSPRRWDRNDGLAETNPRRGLLVRVRVRRYARRLNVDSDLFGKW